MNNQMDTERPTKFNRSWAGKDRILPWNSLLDTYTPGSITRIHVLSLQLTTLSKNYYNLRKVKRLFAPSLAGRSPSTGLKPQNLLTRLCSLLVDTYHLPSICILHLDAL